MEISGLRPRFWPGNGSDPRREVGPDPSEMQAELPGHDGLGAAAGGHEADREAKSESKTLPIQLIHVYYYNYSILYIYGIFSYMVTSIYKFIC